MYSIDLDGAELLLTYTDVFSSDIPDLKEEIAKLNMHKAISIISELIRIRNSKLDTIHVFGMEIKIPFEAVLKKKICEVKIEEPVEIFLDPLFNKNAHIISAQMLLLLLKKVILYGNHETMVYTEYEVSWDDYKKIIQLQLIVAEDISQKHAQEINADHFLYSSYHLNYKRNVANEILRMYYIMEKLSINKDVFEVDVQKEYKDYYKAFIDTYGFSPTQYISGLFFELDSYYTEINGLTYAPIWRNSESIYGHLKAKQDIVEVIEILSQTTEHHIKWATESENQEWDFSGFFEFPFIKDLKGNHLSICDVTLRNSFFEKIFWLIRGCYPKEDSRAMAFFGRLFEKYIQDITRDALNRDYDFIEEFSYKKKKKSKKSSDAYIRKGKDLLVVEAKGFSVLIDCMIRNERVEDNNKKLFIDPILQADACLATVIENKIEFLGVENAYIVSVTMDNINAVPNYYNEIHKNIEANKMCSSTKYYFNLNIEEYEMILYLIEQQYDIFEVLKEYYENKKLKPFGSFIQDKFGEIDMTKFMRELYKEASEKIKETLFHKD